jgi:16S rRNA (uracil1498-N3)-methyltransferase
MSHFYVKPQDIQNEKFLIADEQAHYLINVRRFKINDEIMLFDGLGKSYKAKIAKISKGQILGDILSSSYELPNFIVNLWTAIPKGERFEWLIEKCAELGIKEIIPLKTARSITNSFSQNKMERFKKISISASSQCGRSDIMEIKEHMDFTNACAQASTKKDFINILPWEAEETKTIHDLFQDSKHSNINIFIGPEGGFENQEIDLAKALNFKTIKLGKNILRIETAAIAASILVLISDNPLTKGKGI